MFKKKYISTAIAMTFICASPSWATLCQNCYIENQELVYTKNDPNSITYNKDVLLLNKLTIGSPNEGNTSVTITINKADQENKNYIIDGIEDAITLKGTNDFLTFNSSLLFNQATGSAINLTDTNQNLVINGNLASHNSSLNTLINSVGKGVNVSQHVTVNGKTEIIGGHFSNNAFNLNRASFTSTDTVLIDNITSDGIIFNLNNSTFDAKNGVYAKNITLKDQNSSVFSLGSSNVNIGNNGININGITWTEVNDVFSPIRLTNSSLDSSSISINEVKIETANYDNTVFHAIGLWDHSKLNTQAISINGIDGTNLLGTEVVFLQDNSSLNADALVIKTIHINNIDDSAPGIGIGVSLNGQSSITSQRIEVDDIKANLAYAIDNTDACNLVATEYIKVNNIQGKEYAAGLRVSELSTFKTNNLFITNVNASKGISVGLEIDNYKVDNLQTVNINLFDPSSVKYNGVFNTAASNVQHKVNKIAIDASNDSIIDWKDGQYTIVGDLLAEGVRYGYNGDVAGKINIDSEAKIYGDVYAVDGGQVNLVLKGNDSILMGQTDAWLELDDNKTVFHTATPQVFDLSSQSPYEIPPQSSGVITLCLNNGASWHALGQSSLSLLENNSTVDMTKSPGASVYTQTLKGSGAFNMTLDPAGKNSNMLYVANALTPNSQNTINVKLSDTVRANSSLEDLVGLRFATTGGSSDTYTGNEFKAQMLDQGFNNVILTVGKEAYDKTQTALNEKYNGVGTGEGDYKPGNNYVDHIFGQEGNIGTNWYISGQTVTEPVEPDQPTNPDTKPEKPNNPPESTLSDAGLTILATARSNYWTAVEMDRLNKRLGDARYANGDDGLWLRMRYESNGTNAGQGDFESDAVTYQAGFDHAFKQNNGRWIVGGAVDYKDADVDYKAVTGEGNTDRLGLKVYGTWLGDNGAYVDVNAIWGALSNKFDIVNGSGQKITADYDNNIMGVSAETGHRFMMGQGFFAEPQMQLQYLRVTDANYTTSQGTRMVHDDFDSVISRVGLRGGMEFGEARAHTVYAKADWMHEWSGDQKITAYDVTTSRAGFDASIDNKGSWYDVGFGAQAKFSDASYGFLDMEYRFGNNLDKSWVINAGVRYAF